MNTTNMRKPLVSVIIPMYRVESYLPACLRQLRAQSYKSLELIFVSDASPDKSATLVREAMPLLEQEGFVVHLLELEQNSGVAVARNHALDLATGEYIYSFDADDGLAPETIEVMVQEAIEKGADVVGCECYLRYGESLRRLNQPDVETGREAFEKMCQGGMKWNLWLFLIKRSLLESIDRFEPGQNMGEDMLFMGRLMLRVGRVSIVHQPFYYYDKTNAGAQTSNYSDKQWRQVGHNLSVLEAYVGSLGEGQLLPLVHLLKLNLKLPLLLTGQRVDYERWRLWFGESNAYIRSNRIWSLRTRLLQQMADKGQWWYVRIYHKVVMDWLYRILYK